MVLGRTGQAWEDGLLAQLAAHAAAVAECRTVVDLLVTAEVRAPQVVVVPEDFPRLVEALSRLRGLTPVVVVGRGPSADCPPERADLDSLLAALKLPHTASGRLTTVWGPPGSWGVTSVAIGLARSLARRESTLLLDANVHAPTIGDLLDVPVGGLLQACLGADRGAVSLPARRVARGLSVVSGLDPAMYPAAHPGALQQVLDAAAADFRQVVIDVDSAVDPAGEIGLVPDWTTATAVCLQAADDLVIVVGEGEPALRRLWRSLPAVADLLTGRATVVVNRCSDPRRTTARVAQRLGEFLPEAAVGWIGAQVTEAALAPIVAELAAGAPTATG
ncbi:MAG TPA: hypothetical protein PLT68_08595 [Actinomycetota bacterium]|nr:hypothetical protein [Actinomycetota bacterium]